MTQHNTDHGDDLGTESAAEPTGKPTVKQLVHWATGDREAEAKELASVSPGEVSIEDATVAVKRAHGDVPSERRSDESEVATVQEAEAVHEEKAADGED
jgi:hypothetical protein